MSTENHIRSRIRRAINAAYNDAQKHTDWRVKSAVECMQAHHNGYAEPGYTDPDIGVTILANWNEITEYRNGERITVSDIMPRLCTILEKLGAGIEWSDEWSDCTECGKLVRTSPDSYSWKPSFHVVDADLLCVECVSSNAEAHLEALEGTCTANVFDCIDPSEFGYIKLQDCESGFHEGQTDNPERLAKELRERGISRFVFQVDESRQFDTSWSVWIHESEAP